MLLLPQLSHSELDSDSRAVGSASIRLQTLRFDQRRFAGQVLARHAGLSASYVSAAVGGMRGGGVAADVPAARIGWIEPSRNLPSLESDWVMFPVSPQNRGVQETSPLYYCTGDVRSSTMMQ